MFPTLWGELSCKERKDSSTCSEKQREEMRGVWDRLVICFQPVIEAWLLLCPILPWFLEANTSSPWPQQGPLGLQSFERPKSGPRR